MKKVINLFVIALFFLFFFNIFRFYLYEKNIKDTNLNRLNINEIIKKKTSNLPVLSNDTDNIIEFNSTYADEIKEEAPRNFWNLLKSK